MIGSEGDLTEQVDNSSWCAYVKYKNQDKEIVPITKIKSKLANVKKRIPINPQSLTDFDPSYFYQVLTSHGSIDGTESKWYALIGALAETEDAMKARISKKRIHWPVISTNDDSEPSTSAVESENPVPRENRADALRAQKKALMKLRKTSNDATQEQILQEHILNVPESPSVSVEPSNSALVKEKKHLEDLVAQLEEKLKRAEQQARDAKAEAEASAARANQSVSLQTIDEKFQELKDCHTAQMSQLQEKFDQFVSKYTCVPHHVIDWVGNLPDARMSVSELSLESDDEK